MENLCGTAWTLVEVDDNKEIMEVSEYQNIFENEEQHFYYVTIHNLVLGMIEKYGGPGKRKILDAGCGTGGLINKMKGTDEVRGIDNSPEAIKLCKLRNINVKRGSVTKLPFGDKEFDIVTSIDVIYHKEITDDVVALAEMKRVLKTGGFLILRVPANKFLLSAHDKQVHTARRYSKKEIEVKMTKAGFHTIQTSHVGIVLFFLSLINISIERFSGRKSYSSIGNVPGWINWTFTKVLLWENQLILSGISLPFGQGLIVVAQR